MAKEKESATGVPSGSKHPTSAGTVGSISDPMSSKPAFTAGMKVRVKKGGEEGFVKVCRDDGHMIVNCNGIEKMFKADEIEHVKE